MSVAGTTRVNAMTNVPFLSCCLFFFYILCIPMLAGTNVDRMETRLYDCEEVAQVDILTFY